ncbi:MAG: ABC transporter permease [Actinobacteria bacterium BACL2 MAG-120820-bin50]|jgi:D-xylose transport system permease protein|uniref:Xylose transport system permease protein XylH n=1 Tax=Actinobacteria bacterium BACL2 MAG-120820-bin50 TaxID=1655570 RepID=A0A0R2QPJ5_9ACTN|nr:MAG: ABC transporter permease [Actinobacteria bacterium BACL2 MAG-120820-bin50]KRP31019.1 MAG: ABC transporter permease [Actinobacteria bacterium BACL2 MAG-120507-bin38]
MSQDLNIKQSATDWWSKVKAGQVGALPALLGLFVLCIVFGTQSSVFLTPGNLANLLTQAAAVIVIAMGLVFVLLLGEIDLSAGYAAGVCGALLVIMITKMDYPWFLAFPISVLAGVLLGAIIGYLVAQLKIPSFVVTLATFLAFQGLLLLLVGEGGTIRIEDPVILAVENKNLSVSYSWIFFLLTAGAYLLSGLLKFRKRKKAGLVDNLFKLWVIKTFILIAIGTLATWTLTVERSNNPDLVSLRGIPYVVPVILVLLVGATFVLSRTSFGLHIYAVGGNAEAARRAGINVKMVRITAFMICTGFAAVAGMIFVSRANSISPTTGGSSTLLYAVGAAVIGGTSLFGGKGKVSDAILGGLVVAIIDNGMALLGYPAGIKFMVTGAVLLISASIDAVSRRGASTT